MNELTSAAEARTDPRQIHKDMVEGKMSKGFDSGSLGKIAEMQVRQYLTPDSPLIHTFAGANMPDILYDHAGITLTVEVKTGCAIVGRRNAYGEWERIPDVDIVIYAPDVDIRQPVPEQMRVFTRREFLQLWEDLQLLRFKVSTQANAEYKRIHGQDTACPTNEYADLLTIQTFSNSKKKNDMVIKRCEAMPGLTKGGVDKIMQYAQEICHKDSPEADLRRMEFAVKKLRRLWESGKIQEDMYRAEKARLLSPI